MSLMRIFTNKHGVMEPGTLMRKCCGIEFKRLGKECLYRLHCLARSVRIKRYRCTTGDAHILRRERLPRFQIEDFTARPLLAVAPSRNFGIGKAAFGLKERIVEGVPCARVYR